MYPRDCLLIQLVPHLKWFIAMRSPIVPVSSMLVVEKKLLMQWRSFEEFCDPNIE